MNHRHMRTLRLTEGERSAAHREGRSALEEQR